MTSIKQLTISIMKQINDLNAFEAELRTALKSTGHLFPTTDEEVEYFMVHAPKVKVPEKYRNTDFLLNEDFIPLEKIQGKTIDITHTEQEWALAARNGKEIPQYILDRMHEDKEKAKKK